MSLLMIAASVLSVGHSGVAVPRDVASAVLAKMIANASSGVVLCVAMNGSDPPRAFLKSLREPAHTVVTRSDCHEATDTAHPSYQLGTHHPAHLLDVSDAVWISKTDLDRKSVV